MLHKNTQKPSANLGRVYLSRNAKGSQRLSISVMAVNTPATVVRSRQCGRCGIGNHDPSLCHFHTTICDKCGHSTSMPFQGFQKVLEVRISNKNWNLTSVVVFNYDMNLQLIVSTLVQVFVSYLIPSWSYVQIQKFTDIIANSNTLYGIEGSKNIMKSCFPVTFYRYYIWKWNLHHCEWDIESYLMTSKRTGKHSYKTLSESASE